MTIEEFKQAFNHQIKKQFIEQEGYLPPTISVLSDDGAMRTFPLPPAFLENEKGKNLLANSVIPAVLKGLREEGMNIVCLAFAHNAVMRNLPTAEITEKMTTVEIRALAAKVTPQPVVSITYYTREETKVVAFMYGAQGDKIIFTGEEQSHKVHPRSRFATLLTRDNGDNISKD